MSFSRREHDPTNDPNRHIRRPIPYPLLDRHRFQRIIDVCFVLGICSFHAG